MTEQTGDVSQIAPSSVKRCFDYRLIKKIGGKNPVISSAIIYLIDGGYLWYLMPFKDGVLLHRTDNHPCKGKAGKRSGQAVFNWVFENTDYSVIYGQIHKDNKPARYIAAHAGMHRSFIENDYIYYEIRK